ncbi:right-handed parallel beta-helix repeat-containing protein [Candidatus Poribacteria bacterium]|jgi:polygalacturonase|nr:right-handed parallel beta-helix repeat-containing protein [Candidatus Poribacteria bacterium]MBT5536474.1 right-handed parallel beta-helix repeat-containing protein [Candidatus Poribacteria bacterium]MBT7096941.1 right-handed parallel beta-helix repeat-containing protein [Candidatus Poribacteria bacterium]MBT7806712.1 right-handed parallel beta-helix repeat-containing protein [Candidatus Poribacteria bacterium]
MYSSGRPVERDVLRVRVGPEGGEFVGSTHFALQAAVDYVGGRGGGVVEVAAGTYTLRDAVHLRSGVRIVGQGPTTVLRKAASVTTRLTEDMDWYDGHITVDDPSGFDVGVGVALQAKHAHGQGRSVMKFTVAAVDGRRIRLTRTPHNQARHNFWTTHEPTASTLHPLLTANWERDIAIEDLTLDGNRAENALLDGNYAGCVFLQDCQRVRVAGVRGVNNNGDGISWQVCDDVTVEDCVSEGHANLGLHPGSGSQRPVMRRNTVRDCNIGLFWCWGVRYGVAEENDIARIGSHGMSIGHRDTDNVMRRNTIRDCGKTGIYFRPEDPPARGPHRNVVEENVISGAPIGVNVDSRVRGVAVVRNRFEGVDGRMECGIRIRGDVSEITCDENAFDGVKTHIRDERVVAV